MRETVTFTLNGQPVSLETDPTRKLLWVLRTDLERTGTKYGCGAGLCGACSVLADGEVVRSCITNLDFARGKDVTTIEGLARGGALHPLQQAFYDVGGYQCGYCTPGMILNAYGLLRRNPKPTREQIVAAMEGNLCRCSSYKRIIEAIELAAVQMGGSHE